MNDRGGEACGEGEERRAVTRGRGGQIGTRGKEGGDRHRSRQKEMDSAS